MYRIYLKQGLFLGALVSLCGVLIARLIDIQLFEGSSFVAQADDNRLFTLRLPASRGVLLDRFKQPLVLNNRTYAKKLQPDSLYSELLPVSNKEAFQLLATSAAEVEKQVTREYPHAEVLAHTVGYVGPVTAEDVARDETLLPSEQIGKMGLESYYNQAIRGVTGQQVWEINALVSRQRVISEIQPKDGESMTTSLDPYLSSVAQNALVGKKGSVVIADSETGKIVVLVSSPSFDPNVFSQVATDEELRRQRQAYIRQLFTNPDMPFFNRAVSGAYPPGSVFKLVTALAGLEAGVIDSGTTVVDEGVLKVGEYEYGNWYYRQYGRTEGQISLVRSIARSNDIFFYKTAEWLGINRLASMAQAFGLGQPTGIELSPEAEGLVPTPEWKERVIGEPWYLGNTYHMGIGQGDVLVSPVQMAMLVQTVANNGQQCAPSINFDEASECRSLGLEDTHLALVQYGMLDACSPGGTAFPFFERNEQLRSLGATQDQDIANGAVACKTGTAEFGGANVDGHRKTHAWWGGIVTPRLDVQNAVQTSSQVASTSAELNLTSDMHPAWLEAVKNDSQYPKKWTIVVLVESDETQPFREGSADAGPVAKKIIDWAEQ